MEIPQFQGFEFLPAAPVEAVSAVAEEKNQVVVEDRTDDEIQLEADEIAKKIMELLIESFKKKENRDPTEEEIEHLRDELTAERIAQLLGESNEEYVEGDEVCEDDEDAEVEDDDEEGEGEEEIEAVESDDTSKRSHDCTDDINPDKKSKHDLSVPNANDENIVVN